jgi:hypothetical protein
MNAKNVKEQKRWLNVCVRLASIQTRFDSKKHI